jgi:hypothetical protein
VREQYRMGPKFTDECVLLSAPIEVSDDERRDEHEYPRILSNAKAVHNMNIKSASARRTATKDSP